MLKSIFAVISLAAASFLPNGAAARGEATQVAHTSWLGIRIVQDG